MMVPFCESRDFRFFVLDFGEGIDVVATIVVDDSCFCRLDGEVTAAAADPKKDSMVFFLVDDDDWSLAKAPAADDDDNLLCAVDGFLALPL